MRKLGQAPGQFQDHPFPGVDEKIQEKWGGKVDF
jgi:hypothetical protein